MGNELRFDVLLVTPDPGPDPEPGWDQGLCLLVRAALDGGVDGVQLRAKSLPAGRLLSVLRRLRQTCDQDGARLFVNDRIDVALCAPADGVQLGETGLPVSEAAALLGRLQRGGVPRLLVGASAHSPDGVREKLDAGADFAVFGNVFATPSKPGLEGRGLAGLAAAVSAAGGRPVIAIGGISPGNAGAVRRAGAAGIAVIGAVAGAPDPRAAAAELVGRWREAG